MNRILAPVVCCVAFASTAAAQLSDYLGPGILTHGAGDIGQRGGEQVDLRFYAGVNGIYDNGVLPVSVDSKGDLTQVNGLYGVEAGIGAYGSHSWRTALMSLDYRGDFRYYNNSYWDGSDHNLRLGYTYQASRRLYFDFQGVGGVYSMYLGAVPGSPTSLPEAINQPTLLLFDNPTYFLQGMAGMTYRLSARSSVTVGGGGFWVGRQSAALIGVDGYEGRATYQYRLSRVTSVGFGYTREHYQYPGFFGHSNMDSYYALISTQFGRFWTFSLQGGGLRASVLGLQSVQLDPAIAALLGVSSVVHTFTAVDWIPSGTVSLRRKLKNAALSFSYGEGAVPGNGVYLTSRSENASADYNYSGVRNASLDVYGGYSSLSSLGQGIPPFNMYSGGVGLSYRLTNAWHAVARYDLRHLGISEAGFRQTAYRVTLGIAFSPGTLPLSLW